MPRVGKTMDRKAALRRMHHDVGTSRCDFCNSPVISNGECPSCLAYDAAVHAQKAAANTIAKAFDHRATGAWLNEYGVFAQVRGKFIQIASAEIAKPFVALTGAARGVRFPDGHCWDSGDGSVAKSGST